jgi:predicted transposase YdaD
MLNLKEADVTQTRFYQEVLDIGWQQGRLIGNHYGYKSGHKIGCKIGRQIGWKEGRANIVLRQLARRCGRLSISQQQKVRSLSISDIENLAEALLDFQGIADLEIWLKENVV